MPPEAQNEENERPEEDLRSVIESAYDDATDDVEEGRPAEDAAESVRAAEETPEAGTDSGGPVRDEHGRFAPKTKTKLTESPREGETIAPKTAATQPEGDSPPEAAPTYDKAPASWKPGAREAWGGLAPEVRAEIHRRENETAQVMNTTANARRVFDHMSELQNKYAPALQAEGVDVIQATENLMGMAATMRFGTPLEKAQTAAQIINTYGVDILALDTLLSQQPQQPQQAQATPQQPPRDPRVDQLFQRLEQAQRQRIEQSEQAAAQEVESFGQSKEFFNDVREDMADLLEVAAKRGLELSLEDAYTRACHLQPEIRKVLDARAAAEQAGTRKGSTQRAKKAASSVHGKPAEAPSATGPQSLRAAIEEAMDEAAGR